MMLYLIGAGVAVLTISLVISAVGEAITWLEPEHKSRWMRWIFARPIDLAFYQQQRFSVAYVIPWSVWLLFSLTTLWVVIL